MAAVSGSHTSIVTANSSSPAHFQPPRSSENAPTSSATNRTPLATTNNPRAGSMAQPSASAPSQTMQQQPSRTDTPDRNRGASLTGAFSTPDLDYETNPLLESILRPNKDGRVKNPVPSKLKGKTDIKKGNFSVMHMGTSTGKKNDAGKDAAAERDAAARRTSENTASRAKAAQQAKYVPPRRRGLEAEASAIGVKAGSPFVSANNDQKQRARPLAPDETKFEQARLLTLLRSLNPITVVDQICKAVAYFGGIPGAPPPDDGIFPASANTRETGALFIGWLGEIFPDISSLGVQRLPDAAHSIQPGLSMAPQMNEPPNPSNGFGYGQAISAPVWGMPQAPSVANPQVPSATPETIQPSTAPPAQEALSEAPVPAPPSTPAQQPPAEAPPPSASASKRGRGRPKGSKNKDKGGNPSTTEAAKATVNDTTSQNPSFASEQSHDSAAAHRAIGTVVPPNTPPVQVGSEQTRGTNQAPTGRYVEPSWQSSTQKPHTESSSGTIPTTVDELSPEERAVLEAFRHDSQSSQLGALNPASLQGSAGTKRKRATPKPKVITTPLNQPQEQPQAQPASNNMGGNLPIISNSFTWSSIDALTPTAPAAKRPRPRKPKSQGGSEQPRSQTASVASNSTPPISSHAVPDPTPSSSQQIPPTRPPAEGLEAHYEKFARPQQNGSNYTTTAVQQQQPRQQKPPPVAQQPKPATQMQQQKSQQGSQRDDQKAAQGTSARPSSTGFYNPRGHGSFGQGYPASQTSQIYGTHQSSPQINSTSTNTNNYRTSNTQGLGQASPQFSQTDPYRTTNSRTISQGSPTFSQADTSFRSSSAQSVAQSSPTYAQAEKLYRAATNAQAIPQPTSSFSRSHNSQANHQNHYSHFADNPYTDLPTLDNLNHSGSSTHGGASLSGSGSFGQQTSSGSGGALGPSSRPTGSGSLYGTSSHSSSIFDSTGPNDQLLRAVSRPSGSNGVFSTSSGLGPPGGFDAGAADQDLRERLMRNIGRR